MNSVFIVSSAVFVAGLICFGLGEDRPKTEHTSNKAKGSPSGIAADDAEAKPSKSQPGNRERNAGNPLVKTERTKEETAVRESHLSFLQAYAKADAKAVSGHFTPNAEYVSESGEVYAGREAIEELLMEFFTEKANCKLEMSIESIRFIGTGVAVEDGIAKITHEDTPVPIESKYTTTYINSDGKWLFASIRNHASKVRREHRVQLEDLDWLLGDWIDEGDDSIVKFSCQAVDDGNFLIRTFTIQIAGQEVMTGSQRIGWDPLTGRLRAWIFDSEGGSSEGVWHQDGDNWVLKYSGVTADGESASSTSIYKYVDDHTMTWQSIDHEIAGVSQADSEVITIVRQAPSPVAADDEK